MQVTNLKTWNHFPVIVPCGVQVTNFGIPIILLLSKPITMRGEIYAESKNGINDCPDCITREEIQVSLEHWIQMSTNVTFEGVWPRKQ